MKKQLHLIVNKSTRRVVAWNRRQDERDGMLYELNRCAPGQYVPGLATFDSTGAETFEPGDLTVPPPYRPDFELAKEQLLK